MTIERGLRLVAGLVILLSLLLAWLHTRYWLILTAFVGLNLLLSLIHISEPTRPY